MKKIKLIFLYTLSFLFMNIQPIQTQWTHYLLGTSSYPFDCSFINENTGWVGGKDLKVHFTTDSGVNWTLIDAPVSTDRIECLFFVNYNTGWAGTFSGSVRKTTNGGYNWFGTQVVVNKNILDIFFINENSGWLTGQDGVFRRTTNGGTTWLTGSNFFSETGNTIYFIDSQTGFAGGFYHIAKTTNGGINWDLTFLPYIYVYSIKFLNQQTGWTIGGRVINGDATGLYVLKTSNSGNNWNTICSDTANYGYHTITTDAFFITENVGYLVGRYGYAPPPSSFSGIMRKTTNGGVNWFAPSGFTNSYSVESVTFVNLQTGFAVGFHNGQGIIYKTTNAIGIESISSYLPNKLSLSQNYPNPFNPVTKISFGIPANVKGEISSVKLIIYAVLGREVTILINEQLKPGTYEVDWDASAYPSGVYFYKLTSGDFSETGKMILIR